MAKGPYLAIDYGLKSIGLAISDEDALIALPLKAIDVKKSHSPEREIVEICEDRGVTKIVLGLPLNDDLTDSSFAYKVREFAEGLKDVTDLPIEFVDEHLTTFQADMMLKGKKDVKKADRDAVAAQIILQNFLEK